MTIGVHWRIQCWQVDGIQIQDAATAARCATIKLHSFHFLFCVSVQGINKRLLVLDSLLSNGGKGKIWWFFLRLKPTYSTYIKTCLCLYFLIFKAQKFPSFILLIQYCYRYMYSAIETVFPNIYHQNTCGSRKSLNEIVSRKCCKIRIFAINEISSFRHSRSYVN